MFSKEKQGTEKKTEPRGREVEGPGSVGHPSKPVPSSESQPPLPPLQMQPLRMKGPRALREHATPNAMVKKEENRQNQVLPEGDEPLENIKN